MSFKTLEDVKIFLNEIRKLIDKPCSCPTGTPSEVHALAEYGLELSNISGTLATVYAAMKKLHEEALLEKTLAVRVKYSDFGANERRDIVKGLIADETATLLLAERMERRISHVTDLIRSIISMYKTEINASR